MTPKQFLIAAALLVVTQGSANASQSFKESGVLVCVTDKWAETEPEKGHKLVDAAMRCGVVPDNPALEKYAQDCIGKYEYSLIEAGRAQIPARTLQERRQKLRDLGGRLAPKGIHLQEDRGHRQICGRERWRHLYVRRRDRHRLRWKIQGPIDLAVRQTC